MYAKTLFVGKNKVFVGIGTQHVSRTIWQQRYQATGCSSLPFWALSTLKDQIGTKTVYPKQSKRSLDEGAGHSLYVLQIT